MDLRPFKNMIRDSCGLSFEAEKEALLEERILARMAGRGLAADTDYLACLRRDSAEVRALIDLLTINETYFFREREHLDILADRLAPALLASAKPIRILCAGCSSGEEPYSVMMTLLEKYGEGVGKLVSIIGVDIDSSVLRRAEQGIYSGFSFRGFPERLREKYFTSTADGRYAVKDFVKEPVRFLDVNLKSDIYPDALRDLDVIFYRNVSIYFEPDTRTYIFDKLAGLLKEKGWLFVSSTETLSHFHAALSLVELGGVFCYQKNIELALADRRKQAGFPREEPGEEPRTPAMAAPQPGPAKSPAGVSRAAPNLSSRSGCLVARAERPLFDEALALAKSKDYESALKRIDLLLQEDPSFAKACLLKAGILINLKQLEEAERVCRRSIELDRWSLEGHLLLGLIAKLRNDNETAGRRFREALYIQSSCWLAHFYLADIFAELGEQKNAAREYEIVIRVLEKEGLSDRGLTFFLLPFSAEQIAHLCRHNLAKLNVQPVGREQGTRTTHGA